MSSIILLALIFLCIIFYSLKKRELSNNIIKNQVIFKPKERLSLGNLLSIHLIRISHLSNKLWSITSGILLIVIGILKF